MDRANSEQQSDNGTRDDDGIIFYPACVSNPGLIVSILDTSKGRTVRLFECRCGELIWDD
jgi:hypothetical protein